MSFCIFCIQIIFPLGCILVGFTLGLWTYKLWIVEKQKNDYKNDGAEEYVQLFIEQVYEHQNKGMRYQEALETCFNRFMLRLPESPRPTKKKVLLSTPADYIKLVEVFEEQTTQGMFPHQSGH